MHAFNMSYVNCDCVLDAVGVLSSDNVTPFEYWSLFSGQYSASGYAWAHKALVVFLFLLSNSHSWGLSKISYIRFVSFQGLIIIWIDRNKYFPAITYDIGAGLILFFSDPVDTLEVLTYEHATPNGYLLFIIRHIKRTICKNIIYQKLCSLSFT